MSGTRAGSDDKVGSFFRVVVAPFGTVAVGLFFRAAILPGRHNGFVFSNCESCIEFVRSSRATSFVCPCLSPQWVLLVKASPTDQSSRGDAWVWSTPTSICATPTRFRRRSHAMSRGRSRCDGSRSAPYMNRTKNFPRNTELESIPTFKSSEPGPWVRSVTPAPESLTVRITIRSSLCRTGSFSRGAFFTPTTGRAHDVRMGLFGVHFFDYATPISEPIGKRQAVRYRLEKRDPSAAISDAVELEDLRKWLGSRQVTDAGERRIFVFAGSEIRRFEIDWSEQASGSVGSAASFQTAHKGAGRVPPIPPGDPGEITAAKSRWWESDLPDDRRREPLSVQRLSRCAGS